jgi:hypothetical protein
LKTALFSSLVALKCLGKYSENERRNNLSTTKA